MRTRGNGLSAASYVPLAEIDPRATTSILDALREAGVAAYAVAATSRSSLGWDIEVPSRPVDRLYVDAAASAAARGVLDIAFAEPEPPRDTPELGSGHDDRPADTDKPPGSGDQARAGPAPAQAGEPQDAESPARPDLDSAWQQIIAGFDSPPNDEVPSWPAEEDVADDEPAREGRVIRKVEAAEPAELTEPGRPGDGAESEDEHFVPPPPPPLPPVQPVTKLAWAGVLGGPALLLGYAFGLGLPTWLPGIAVFAFIGGFTTLVMRLKDHPDEDPDDGAVV